GDLAYDADARRRFEREARISAHIASDHVVQVLAAGVDTESGRPWLLMELLHGEDLASYVRRTGAMTPEQTRAGFKQLRHALLAAHAAGIVHRDLKPETLFLSPGRRAGALFTLKVLDFGIAKIVAEAPRDDATAPIGSMLWMAPEQTELGATITSATDTWAV